MINIYPAFQFLFRVGHAHGGRMSIEVFGTEALARLDTESECFERPEGTSWRSVDLRMAEILQQNAAQLPSKDTFIFINASQYSLNDDESFFRWLTAVSRLRHSLGREQRVVVEITEHVTTDCLRTRWRAIKECGLKMAVDDYGVGESTLERLQMFPWDFCKFDLAAVTEADLAVGVDYCWKAKIEGVAEKVETRTQSRDALNRGLCIQQGYLFCRPMTKKLDYEEDQPCAKVS